MSSNGFLTVTEIRVFSTRDVLLELSGNRSGHPCLLRVGSDGAWSFGCAKAMRPVLMLHHRSFWGRYVAGLTVKPQRGKLRVCWAIRSGVADSVWRRLRARFACR